MIVKRKKNTKSIGGKSPGKLTAKVINDDDILWVSDSEKS